KNCRTPYINSMHDNVSSGSPSGRNDGKSCHPGSATGNLYCNNVLPGTATGNIFFSYQRSIVPFRNRNMEIIFQEQRLIVPFRNRNKENSATWQCAIRIWNMEISATMATCHQDPEPELDYRLELDVL